MPVRGRRPIPTALKVLAGNPGQRPLPENEPKPGPANLEPPEHLDEVARAEWVRMAPLLARLHVMGESDERALSLYCETWSLYREAEKHLKTEGMVVEAKNGYMVASPYMVIADKALRRMQSLLVEFGMTPSSRTRVTALLKDDTIKTRRDPWTAVS